MRSRRLSLSVAVFSVLLLFGVAEACRHAPPTASPQAQIAFQATRAIKALDLLRDYATDANAQNPPLINTDLTRKIVVYHRSAITTIHDFPSGWKPSVQTGLDEVLKDLPADTSAKLAPYVSLVKAILVEVK